MNGFGIPNILTKNYAMPVVVESTFLRSVERASERASWSEHMFNIRVSVHSYDSRIIHFTTPRPAVRQQRRCNSETPLNVTQPMREPIPSTPHNCVGEKQELARAHTPRLPRSS